MLHYGLGFEKGFLGNKDLNEAKKYYKMSAAQGNKFGLTNFKRLQTTHGLN
jgi:TPR repeat protein